MRSPPSSSYCLEAELSLSSSSSRPAVSSATETSEMELPLIEKTSTTSSKSAWFSDVGDHFILLCSFLLIATSIVLVALVFYFTVTSTLHPPRLFLFSLQKVVATFSLSTTTAVIMVIGKRYVLFKLGREGLRSRRVATYSNPSIWNIANHLFLHGMELPLLGLSVVWGLASATGLTANDTWEFGPISFPIFPPILSGPLNPRDASSSYLLAAAAQLAVIMLPPCRGEDSTSESSIQVTNASVSTDHPTGVIYYPTIPQFTYAKFSYSTTMNGFNVSMEQLSSIPSTAQNLTCTNLATSTSSMELWSAGSDNQTLSIILVNSTENTSITRFNATALIVGGTLSSNGSYTAFALNGTSWPNVMATGNQWAQDIITIICNTTCPSDCGPDWSLFTFADYLNEVPTNDPSGLYQIVSSTLNIALGTYSSVVLPSLEANKSIPITMYYSTFTTRYGTYILIANIIVSIFMLVTALRLCLASPLSSDFMNSTRLLLDPLTKPELFNASLDRTVKALGDPYMLVRDNSVFLLAEEKSKNHRRRRRNFFELAQDQYSIQSED